MTWQEDHRRDTVRPGASRLSGASNSIEMERHINISEWGFTLFTPDGEQTRFEGTLAQDELHDSSIFGLLNISEAWRCIPRNNEPAVVPIEEGLRANIRRLEYDPAYAAAISIQRRGEPILMAPGPDGWHVVDGIHRLQRRIADGLPAVKCHYLSPKLIKRIRVQRFAWVRNKRWKAADSVTDAKFKQLMRGSAAFYTSARPGEG